VGGRLAGLGHLTSIGAHLRCRAHREKNRRSIVPEGHTIHRLARDHRRLLAGRVVRASSPQGRFLDGAARIDGSELRRTEAYGKHLFHSYPGVGVLHVHLGLYGKFTTGPLPPPEPRGALRLRLSTQEVYVDLRGPTACELLTPVEQRGIVARLGPDPLRTDADPDRAWTRLSRSRVVVGALLMDQSVLAGIGNVYRAEILFRHALGPHRPGTSVTEAEWRGLWDDLVVLMKAGVRSGRIVTTKVVDRDRRGPVRRDDAHYVYRRAGLPCRICGTEIRTEVLVGRNLFWCPHCQPD